MEGLRKNIFRMEEYIPVWKPGDKDDEFVKYFEEEVVQNTFKCKSTEKQITSTGDGEGVILVKQKETETAELKVVLPPSSGGR